MSSSHSVPETMVRDMPATGPPAREDARAWFLIARHGEVVVRVRPGMSLGESPAGVLCFDPAHAQLELDVAGEGELVARGVRGYRLEAADGSRGGSETLPRDRWAELHLPHNLVRLGTDFTEPLPGSFIKVRALRPARPAAGPQMAATGGMRPRAARTGGRRYQVPVSLLAVLMWLTGIGTALLHPGVREGAVSELPTPVGGAPLSASASSPPALSAIPNRESDDKAAERVRDALPEPRSVPAPAIEPVVVPPVQRRSLPRSERSARVAEAAAAAQGGEQPPDPSVVAELEETGRTVRALAAELEMRRDRIAADLALAQGRLTAPAQTSAYTLYSRVLAQDPGSAEARMGLESVRQHLINRALAELARGALEDADRSLRAAAEAGAPAELIAGLRSELDYQQRLTDSLAR